MKLKFILIFCLSLIIFSYKIGTVPSGLTIDEASFGYNAVLLSRTGRDENGRFLPVFILSINKTDWRQPITQYFITSFFKIFSPSVFTLRFTSAIIGAISVSLIYLIGGIWASILLIFTPVFFMHTHLGLDNIMPVPFILVWLICLLNYSKNKNIKNLIIAGITIGISIFSYKGIRVFIPVWLLTSTIYIFLQGKMKAVFIYLLSALPFFVIIPYLEFQYAGAVLNNTKLDFSEPFRFVYRFLSNFDFSFLFGKGDDMLIHSTGLHGALLLMSLPLFIIGLLKSWKKNIFYKFLIISIFLGPILFGFFGLIHRASKMISLVPFYCLISAFGAKWLYKEKKSIFILLSVLILFNFSSFLGYYWFKYGPSTEYLFYGMTAGQEYKTLKEISTNLDLKPFVDSVITSDNFSSGDFMRSIYFTKMPDLWNGNIKDLPKGSVLMTDDQNIKSLEKLDYKVKNFVFYKN
ncbi:MAG: glycosyltransferase family 39 protein [Candidatus Woesebacteria bacterium]|nr:glycosyltransferase family 39 protein [Candidatus Woesebacteria bacterium]